MNNLSPIEPYTARRHGVPSPGPMRIVADGVAFYNDLFAGRFGASTLELMDEAIDRHQPLFKAQHTGRVLRPCMVHESTYRTVCSVAARLARAITVAADRLAADPALRRTLRLPEYLEPLIAIDATAGQHSMMSRFDGFVTGSGLFKMMEFNAAPGGAHVAFELNHAFQVAPIARAFSRRFRFRWLNVFDLAFAGLVREHRRQGFRGTPTVGLVALDHELVTSAQMRWLPYAAARGCRLMVARAEEFTYANRRLTVDGLGIDLLMLVNWKAIIAQQPDVQPLLEAVRDGSVRVVHGLSRGLLCGYKNTLELLSDPAHRSLFDGPTAAALTRHVPWTRVVRECRTTGPRGNVVDLVDYVADHKEGLVLKPSGGRGGAGILLGWRCTPDEWNRVLRRRTGNYVVQERVIGHADTYPVGYSGGVQWRELTADCGPYVWDGAHVAGWLARASDSGLHNISGGAMNAPVWIVDARTPTV